MLHLLNELVAWWHWIVLGLLLLVVEVNSGTFLFFGLGIAAVSVGVFDYFYPVSFTYAMLSWSILSIGYMIAWKKWFSKEKTSNTGQSDYNLEMEGIVTKKIAPHKKGKVHFDVPLLGESEWIAVADEPIEVGEKIKIVEVLGQIIKVKKENNHGNA